MHNKYYIPVSNDLNQSKKTKNCEYNEEVEVKYQDLHGYIIKQKYLLIVPW